MLGLLISDYLGQAGARVVTGRSEPTPTWMVWVPRRNVFGWARQGTSFSCLSCLGGYTWEKLEELDMLKWVHIAWWVNILAMLHGSAFLGEVPVSTRHGCQGVGEGSAPVSSKFRTRQDKVGGGGRGERERGVLTMSRRRWRWSITAAAAKSSPRSVSSDCQDSFRVLLYFLLWAMVGLGQNLYCIAFLN